MLKKLKQIFNIKLNNSECTVDNKIDNLFATLSENVAEISMGSDLTQFKPAIINIIGALRKEIKDECGFIIPAIAIKNNLGLQENEFCILLRGQKMCERFVIPTSDDTCADVYDALKTVVYDHLEDIFTNELTEKYINTVQKNNYLLVWNITNILSVIDIKTILSDLIFKGKSIENISYIFEKIGESILSGSGYNNCIKQFNPHTIAKQIAQKL